MDATPSAKRKRLLSTVFALSLAVVVSSFVECSRATAEDSTSSFVVTASSEQDSRASSSASGTLTFVAPKQTSSPASSAEQSRSKVRSHEVPTKRARATSQQGKQQSAKGDLVLVQPSQTRPNFRPNPSVVRRGNPQDLQTPTPLPQTAASVQRESPFVEYGSREPQVVTNEHAGRRRSTQPSQVRQLSDAIRAASENSSLASREPKTAQPAVRTERVRTVQHQQEVSSKDTLSQLLVDTHALSLEAKTETDYTTIIRQCTKAVGLSTDKAMRKFAYEMISWALNRRGQLRADQGLQDLADTDFRSALDYNPHNWRALHNRGVSLAQGGFFAEAFDDFNRVVQINPQYAKAFANRATLFVQANDLQTALEDYLRATELDPKLATAQVGAARAYHMLGQWDKSLTHFEEAVKLDPVNCEYICSRGDLLADMGHYREALADYARTIEINPNFAHAYRNGAWLLATCPDEQFRDPENAIQGARQALEFDYGERHVALDTMAAALASAGRFEEAINTLSEAMNLAPPESKVTYDERLRLYTQKRPFHTDPVGSVSQVVYEVTDQ